MKRIMSKLASMLCLSAAMLCSTTAAQAQGPQYPTKPITLIVPFAPGGSTDILGRLVGAELQHRLGQSVIVDNRSGANGNIGTGLAARAPADGYTLLMANAGTNVVNPSLYNTLGWDPIKDFTPLAMVARVDNVVVASRSVKANTLKELADFARANPGSLNYGSVGPGSIFHLAAEIFSQNAKVKMTHVPYRGASPALTDLMGGQIEVMFATIPGALQYIKSKKVKAIAVTGKSRSSVLPDVPTAVEAGFPNVVIDNWFAVLGPANVPADVKEKLTRAINDMVQDKAFQDKLKAQGAEPYSLTGDALKQLMVADIEDWRRVVSSVGITKE